MEQNIQLDAMLVHARIHGLIVPYGIGSGKTPNEIFLRMKWLRKQPDSYLKKVSDRVVEIENESQKYA